MAPAYGPYLDQLPSGKRNSFTTQINTSARLPINRPSSTYKSGFSRCSDDCIRRFSEETVRAGDRLGGDQAKLTEGLHQIFGLRSEYGLTVVRTLANARMRRDAPFDQIFPDFGVDDSRALGAGVPVQVSKIGSVFLEHSGNTAKIAT